MEKYTIDLETILQILGGFHQNGLLQGDLPVRKVGNKVPWQAHLRLIEGQVASCTLFDDKGQVVQEGESALNALHKAGQINWIMNQEAGPGPAQAKITRNLPLSKPLPSQPLSPPPQRRVLPSSLVPRRLITISAEQMNQGRWPRSYRQIYAMIDGVRTIEIIANLLTLPVSEVEYMMYDLQKMNIIILGY